MNKPREKSSSESQPQTASGAPTREEIELRAYQTYVERGRSLKFAERRLSYGVPVRLGACRAGVPRAGANRPVPD